MELIHPKVSYVNTVSSNDLANFSSSKFGTNFDSCEPNSSMLGAELAYDQKIKVVTLLEFYNFALGYTTMQTFYDIVQPRSNISLENDDLLYIYVLETKLALV